MTHDLCGALKGLFCGVEELLEALELLQEIAFLLIAVVSTSTSSSPSSGARRGTALAPLIGTLLEVKAVPK